MKRNFKYLTLIMLFLFTAIALIGCGNKSPRQAFVDAAKQNESAKSFKMKGAASLQFTTGKNLSANELKQLEMLNNAQLTWDGVIQKDPQKGILNFNIKVQGIIMESTLYIKDDKGYIKLPQALVPIDKYLEVDLKQIEKEANKDKNSTNKETQALAQSLFNDLYQSIKDDKFKDGDKKDIDGEKARVIKVELNDKDFRELLHKLGDLITSDKYKSLINNSAATKKSPADMKKDIDQTLTDMEKEVQFKNLLLNVVIDKKGFIREENVEMAIKSIKDDSEIKVKLNSSIYDIDKTPEFKFPDFNQNNTMPINDLSKANPLMGGLGTNIQY